MLGILIWNIALLLLHTTPKWQIVTLVRPKFLMKFAAYSYTKKVYKYFIYLSAEVPSKVAKYVLTIIYNKLVPSLNFKVL